ncbi:peptidoglycan D,D-transpeptidase FtsI family protein [Thiomicrorhabdus aquaedulcis]|uniref:peptidoglycan D,D-transpeptidase FtsI family protein n=1 Tax=Thiomicrorhabdus aquaedulcis TaxID=2211106 RepID=UPI000FDC6BE8|nr:penicillin-binding protein 2 [Thiomicrorhabdus aquaedulcis]
MFKLRRDNVVFWLIVVGMLLIVGRAFHVQVIKTQFLQDEGDKRHIRTIEIPAPRGEIYDRNGSLLALSTPMASVWVDPKVMVEHESQYLRFLRLINKTDAELTELAKRNKHKRLSFVDYAKDRDTVAAIMALELPGIYTKLEDIRYTNGEHSIEVDKSYPSVWVDLNMINRYRYSYSHLAELLSQSSQVLAQKIRDNNQRRFMYLQRSITPEVAAKVEDLNLVGVYTQDEFKRYYPAGESTAHLVGFTNIDDKGIEGIELAYDDWLKGSAGKKQVVKDRAGHVVDFVRDVVPAKPGKSMTLSIDQNIQFFAYRALKAAMIQHQALSASSIILDAKTGEILSLVNLPGYNPNDPSQRTSQLMRNRAVTDLMEPGSTVKPFIIAKALDKGVITPESQIDTSPGYFRVQGRRFSDTHNNGVLSPESIIQKSSNVGAAKIALMLTPQEQRDLMDSIGFGRDSGLFLPGESTKALKPISVWTPLDQASASFGYGFNINLLNLAHAYLLLANQGNMMPLSAIKLNQPPVLTPVIKAKAANDTLLMMEKVVAPGGTAVKGQIPGYRVAGKTGTSHKTKRLGGYEENTYLSQFAGIVPVSNPDMVMVVLMNEPSRGVYYGGAVAAPVFSQVMQEALRLRNIAPDALSGEHRKSK